MRRLVPFILLPILLTTVYAVEPSPPPQPSDESDQSNPQSNGRLEYQKRQEFQRQKRRRRFRCGAAILAAAGFVAVAQWKEGALSIVTDDLSWDLGSDSYRLNHILDAYADGAHPWRKYHSMRLFIPKLGKLLLSKDPNVQSNAAQYLYSIDHLEYSPSLLTPKERKALFDVIESGLKSGKPIDFYSWDEARALVDIDPDRAFDSLKSIIENSNDVAIQEGAVVALGSLNRPEVVKYLSGLKDRTKDSGVRGFAIAALGELQAPETKGTNAGVYGLWDRNPFADFALQKDLVPTQVTPLKNLPTSPALLFLNGKSVKVVKWLLPDPKSLGHEYKDFDAVKKAEIREALPQLGYFSNPEAEDYLLDVLQTSTSDELTAMAIQALGWQKSQKAFPKIISLLEDPRTSSEIQRGCIKALWYYDDPKTASLIRKKFMYSDDPEVRRAAGIVLRKFDHWPEKK